MTGKGPAEVGRLTPRQVQAVVCHPRDDKGRLVGLAGGSAAPPDPIAAVRRRLRRLGITDPERVQRCLDELAQRPG